MNASTNSTNLLDNALEQNILQKFVEKFSSDFPLFPRPSMIRSSADPSSHRSRATARGNSSELIRHRVKTRELASRDWLVADRSLARKEGLIKFIENLKRNYLTKRAWIPASA